MKPCFANVEVRQTDDGAPVTTLSNVRIRTILGNAVVEYGGKAYWVFFKDGSSYIVVPEALPARHVSLSALYLDRIHQGSKA